MIRELEQSLDHHSSAELVDERRQEADFQTPAKCVKDALERRDGGNGLTGLLGREG